MEKVKIYIGKHHLAYINEVLFQKYLNQINNINKTSAIMDIICDNSPIEYDFLMKDTKVAIEELTKFVQEKYYDNIGEWLQFYMRMEIL